MSSRAKLALATGGIALAALPSVAEAAQIVVSPCSRAVLGQETVPVQGTGFTPNGAVTLRTAEGGVLGTAVVDPGGNFTGAFDGSSLLPSLRSTKITTQLTATDSAGVAAPAVPFQMVRVNATLPERAKPGSRVKYTVTGFPEGKRVYLHIRRGGKTRGSFRIAAPKGDCGVATRRMKYMPLRSYSTGTYEYWFQQSPRFRRGDFALRLQIQIVRRVRFR